MPLLLLVVFGVAGSLYLLLSAADYGDINADGLKLGQAAYQQGDYDAALKWFRLAAKKGDKQAQYLFAMLYRDGQGVSADNEQAVFWLRLAAGQQQPEAQYQLANMLEYGRGVDEPDLKAAVGWYKKSAEAGNSAAQLRMAVLLSEGRGLAKDDAQALLWGIKAAASKNKTAIAYLQRLLNRITAKAATGDAAAQFILARMYQQGRGLNADAAKAEQWLQQSALRGNAKAQYHLAELLMHRNAQEKRLVRPEALSQTNQNSVVQQAAAWYLKAAAQGDMHAAAQVGALYALGRGLPRDQTQALTWLQKAAESGLAVAQRNLAILLAASKDDDMALLWFNKAAQQGEPVAQNNLALMYALGQGTVVNLSIAVSWLKAAAEAGDAKAQYNLALMYLRAVGMVQDGDAALMWLRKAQKQDGDVHVANAATDSSAVRAKLLLGILYDLGEGVVPNESDAESWYQQASSLGNTDALYNLASLYYRHLKFKKAIDLFITLAKRGDAEAQNTIASMYQSGQGSVVDVKRAVSWYQQAAEHGYAPAQFNLANLYRKGEAMAQQDEQAVHWYTQAAKQGFAPAQNALAYMYALGRGVTVDRRQAQFWFAKAAEQKLAIALQNLSVLKQQKSSFTLTKHAVDVHLRADVLYEKPLGLATHLLGYHQPQLR